MKSRAKILLMLVLAVMMGLTCLTSACSRKSPNGDDATPSSYSVVFDSDGGTVIANQTVDKGGKVTKPATPVKLNSTGEYEFIGWFYGDKQWDFENDTVNQNLVLRAKYKATSVYTPEYLPDFD